MPTRPPQLHSQAPNCLRATSTGHPHQQLKAQRIINETARAGACTLRVSLQWPGHALQPLAGELPATCAFLSSDPPPLLLSLAPEQFSHFFSPTSPLLDPCCPSGLRFPGAPPVPVINPQRPGQQGLPRKRVPNQPALLSTEAHLQPPAHPAPILFSGHSRHSGSAARQLHTRARTHTRTRTDTHRHAVRGAAAHTGLSARKTLPKCPHRHPCTRRGHRVRRTPTLALLLHGFLSCAPGSWTPARPGPGPMPGTHRALGKVQRNRACRRGGGLNLLDEDGGAGGNSRLLIRPPGRSVRRQPRRSEHSRHVKAWFSRTGRLSERGRGCHPGAGQGLRRTAVPGTPAGEQQLGRPTAEAQHPPPGGASAPCHPCLRLDAW